MRPPTEALLVLEDGATFRGQGLGSPGTATGEAVFNTAMTGYQEVLTDPSYRGQVVTMTTAHVGVYGANDEDPESDQVQVAAFVVREASRTFSNHRGRRTIDEELRRAGVVGIAEVDTRRLTRHLRAAGAMRAGVSTELLDPTELLALVRAAPSMAGTDLATAAGTSEAYVVSVREPRFHVVVYDFGLKRTILRLLGDQGCSVTVVPATTPSADVLGRTPDGVFVSNGPGDPAAVSQGVGAIRGLFEAEVPVFGICLGHQLLGLAAGGSTYKLTVGHHGANQPVRNVECGTVEVTSHNHGFAVDAESLPEHGPFGRVRQTHVNLNDGVNEGLRLLDLPAFSVQYHPEGGPGPHDARYLFRSFTELMDSRR